MAKKKFFEIGSRIPCEGGAQFILGETDNGFCYKSEKNIVEKKGICYIAECCCDDNAEIKITIDNINELINNGSVETWDSACTSTEHRVEEQEFAFFKEYWKDAFIMDLFNGFVEKITTNGLYQIDWQCYGTWLVECDLDTELEYYLQERFVKFAKEIICSIKKQELIENMSDEEFQKDLFDILSFGCFYNGANEPLPNWSMLVLDYVKVKIAK